jgi:prepilin-type N-terminal cleavage/methylation domain-containing protein
MMKRAFTLVEILVVVAIVAVLAGLLVPTLVQAKRRAKEPVDVSNMRQLYMAFVMYEDDRGHAPTNLIGLKPYVTDNRIFDSPEDVYRRPLPSGLWPARPFIPCTYDYSAVKLSYAYLRTFPPYDESEVKWRAAREDSKVGLIASPWSGSVVRRMSDRISGCGESDASILGAQMDGPILRINMDGSFFRLPSNRAKGTMGSPFDFFINR